MAVVRPFRALRYDEDVAGPLESLVAPPYDVISAEERERYLTRSPHNVVHLTLPDDEAGAALVVSGLSGPHRAYLAGGGYGFLIGDGALDYGPEVLGEIFYRLALTKQIAVGANYQPIVHPAFNRERGPVHVFTARAHVAF